MAERSMNPDDIRALFEAGTQRAAERAEYVAKVEKAVACARALGKTALVVIHGPPRETHMVVAGWAYLARDRYDLRATFCVDLARYRMPTGVDLAEVLRCMLRHARVPWWRIPRGLAARTATFRHINANRQALVVILGVDQSAQARPFISGPPGSAVIVTTERRLAALGYTDGAVYITVTESTVDKGGTHE